MSDVTGIELLGGTPTEAVVETETEPKALFDRLLHGPKVRRIMALVAEEAGIEASEFLASFEAAFEADGGRVRAPKNLSDDQILALADMVRNRTSETIAAAKASLKVKSVATLNDLVTRHALRIVASVV